MNPFVKILAGRYETDGTTVRSLTRGGTLSKHSQGGQNGYRLRPGKNASQVFYSMNMIQDLYRNAVATSKKPAPFAPIIQNRSGNFIIGSRDASGNHSISAIPMKHPTLGQARAEAERLGRYMGPRCCSTSRQTVLLQILLSA